MGGTALRAQLMRRKPVAALLRMEPYATMFENERPESRIIAELYYPDIDKLFASLGLSLDDFYAVADKDGRHAWGRPETPSEGRGVSLQSLVRASRQCFPAATGNPERARTWLKSVTFPTSVPGWC